MLRECLPPPMCHMSDIMGHVSFVTCHMSHVTCNIFFVFLLQSGEASRERVYYQQGLTRLVSNQV